MANHPAADHIVDCCPGLEVSAGPCSGPTSGNRSRSSLCSMKRGVTLCPVCSYFHDADPCILGGWPHCVEWASPRFILAHSSLARKLFFLAVQGSGALLRG